MTTNEWVFWIGTGVVIADTIIAWTHIVLYAVKSRLRLIDEGWALMMTIGSYALVLTYVAVSNLQYVTDGISEAALQGYPQRGIVRGLIFTLTLLVLTRWLVLLIRNLRRTEES